MQGTEHEVMDKGGLESIPDGAFEDGEGSKWTTWARGSVIYMRECAPVFLAVARKVEESFCSFPRAS